MGTDPAVAALPTLVRKWMRFSGKRTAASCRQAALLVALRCSARNSIRSA
jgi:hypothetical protein